MSSQIKTEGCALFTEAAEADTPSLAPPPPRPLYTCNRKMSLSGSGAHEKRPQLIFMCTDVINEREEGGEEAQEEEEERIEWRADLARLAARPCFITSTTARPQMRSNPPVFPLPRVQTWLRLRLAGSRFPFLCSQGGFCTGLTVADDDLSNKHLSIRAPLWIYFFFFFGLERREEVKKSPRSERKRLVA